MAKKKVTGPQLSPEEPTEAEIEAARLERERRRNKGRAMDPDPAPEPIPDPPSEDNDITSIRTATPEDPTGQEEIIIDNNATVPVNPAESDSETSI